MGIHLNADTVRNIANLAGELHICLAFHMQLPYSQIARLVRRMGTVQALVQLRKWFYDHEREIEPIKLLLWARCILEVNDVATSTQDIAYELVTFDNTPLLEMVVCIVPGIFDELDKAFAAAVLMNCAHSVAFLLDTYPEVRSSEMTHTFFRRAGDKMIRTLVEAHVDVDKFTYHLLFQRGFFGLLRSLRPPAFDPFELPLRKGLLDEVAWLARRFTMRREAYIYILSIEDPYIFEDALQFLLDHHVQWPPGILSHAINFKLCSSEILDVLYIYLRHVQIDVHPIHMTAWAIPK